MTITTPRGHKVRFQTKSAFVLVRESEADASVLKRSSSLTTLRTVMRRSVIRAGVGLYVFSATTGEQVRV